MGCARSICCRYFFLTNAFPLRGSVLEEWLLHASVFPAGFESCPILSKFQCCLGVKRGWWTEEWLHQQHAEAPGSLPACHGEAAGHPRCPVWRMQSGVWWSGVRTEMEWWSHFKERLILAAWPTADGKCQMHLVYKVVCMFRASMRCFQWLLNSDNRGSRFEDIIVCI